MKKRILNVLFVCMVIVGLMVVMSISASAASPVSVGSGTWGGIDWVLTEDGTLTISPTKGTPTTDNSGKWSYEVGQWPEAVIYTQSGGASSIGGRPYKQAAVKKLVIKEGVTSIGSFTANGFTNLTGEVVIPSTVTYIGQEAFQNSTMTKLTFAKVPEGQTGKELCIAQGAFKNLIVEEIALPDDRPVHIHAWTFLNSKKLKTLIFPATLTGVTGTNHVDYTHNPNAQMGGNAGSAANIDNTNEKLEVLIFEDKNVQNLVSSKIGLGTKYTVVNVSSVQIGGGNLTLDNLDINHNDNENIESGSATFAPSENTVVLDNFVYSGGGNVIQATESLTILLKGKNVIDGNIGIPMSTFSLRNTVKLNLTLKGNNNYIADTLTITSDQNAINLGGGTLTIQDATVVTNSLSGNINIDNSIVIASSISPDATLTFVGGASNYAIYAGNDESSASLLTNPTVEALSKMSYIRIVPKFTITKVYGNGLAGETVHVPADTTSFSSKSVDKMAFAGWYDDAACTQAHDFSTPFTANDTLYAKYVKIPERSRVSFVADGRLVGIILYRPSQTELTTVPKVPAKEGYLGTWETYTLNGKNMIVRAVYTPIN